MSFYPVFLNLNGRKCVVVGGGRVAERKVHALIQAGARVTVISPEITKKLQRQKQRGLIRHIARKYSKSYLRGAFLVIAATDSYEENSRIAADAGTIPVNVVDTPELCSFIVPSVVRRGPLTIAISTSGASPALSKAIRKEIERLYPKSFSRYVAELKKKRKEILSEVKDSRLRQRLLKSFVSAAALQRLRQQ